MQVQSDNSREEEEEVELEEEDEAMMRDLDPVKEVHKPCREQYTELFQLTLSQDHVTRLKGGNWVVHVHC